ncbi:MAG: peptide chain release factor N(5)-glutamine methyltransferase [Rhodospirillaceae bacterium]|nr:peptide chain release factor N(5)-glutamine methyltransferase [Rhodospirillaceae bacterium]
MAQQWTIGRAVTELTAAFSAAGLDTPRLDARILVGHAVNLEPSLLFARADRILTDAESVLVRDFAARRQQHEPVSRITGHRGFWSLDFLLSPDTLDPRADTETLVAAVLERRAQYPSPRILDLGTGTGCILLAILKDWPEATGIGIDLNPGAVEMAARNAARLGLASRTDFRVGNWCDGVTEKLDIIVSNPPYITDSEMDALAPTVARFDPALALRGGADGLGAYRALIPAARAVLADGGRLFLEIGAAQTADVAALLQNNDFGPEVAHRDLAGFVRCLEAVTV